MIPNLIDGYVRSAKVIGITVVDVATTLGEQTLLEIPNLIDDCVQGAMVTGIILVDVVNMVAVLGTMIQVRGLRVPRHLILGMGPHRGIGSLI